MGGVASLHCRPSTNTWSFSHVRPGNGIVWVINDRGYKFPATDSESFYQACFQLPPGELNEGDELHFRPMAYEREDAGFDINGYSITELQPGEFSVYAYAYPYETCMKDSVGSRSTATVIKIRESEIVVRLWLQVDFDLELGNFRIDRTVSLERSHPES